MKRNYEIIVTVLVIALFVVLLAIFLPRTMYNDLRTVTVVTERRAPGPTRADAITYDYLIGNKSTKKFHSPYCPYLPDHPNQVTFDSREEAVAAGYSPCGHCHP